MATTASYQRHKERARDRAAIESARGRDIGQLPPVANPARKAECRRSFRRYCETYFPEKFRLEWSQDHLHAIQRIEDAVLRGGLFALAMPRGSGKTTLCEAAVLWATSYGHRVFVVLIGADKDVAQDSLETMKAELETNALLAADFAEICFPIQRLAGIVNRGKGQTYHGRRTRIQWTDGEIRLPTIAGSPASGARILVRGITGRIRGLKRGDDRPDLVIIDDPQTDESAHSPLQCTRRLETLMGAVLGLAGSDRQIAGIMPCTVISPGDLADTILDQARYPEWQGHRTKLVYAFPDNAELWEEYARRRADSLRRGNRGKEATEYYREHQAEMDRGARVAWPARRNKDELSAIQHAMNLRYRNEAAFWAEYQNDPLREGGDEERLTPATIKSRLNCYPRRIVPTPAATLTAYIDVQKSCLYYGVLAWARDFTGYVIDYGTWPDQARRYFTLADARKTLARAFPKARLEGQLYGGFEALCDELLGREYKREGGGVARVERCFIDANWGQSTDTVYQFCRESRHAAILTPAHGRFIGATSKPFSEYRRSKGDHFGDHWWIPTLKGRKRTGRHILIDVNFWKSFIHDRLAAAAGDPGSLTLWGDDPATHEMIADHLVAEIPVKVAARGRVVSEWKQRPNKPDNHLLDILCGAAAAASVCGCQLLITAAPATKRPANRRKVTYLDL